MNKKEKALFLAGVLSLGMCFGACGGANNPDSGNGPTGSSTRPAGKKIVIYAGGSSEFQWVAGSEEERAIDYIEQKYYDDTGISLDFEVAYLGENMQSKLGTVLSSGGVDVIISHTRGGVGVDDYLIGNEAYYDIRSKLYSKSKNLVKYIEGDPLNAMTTPDNKVVGIPSVVSPYKFGILVRKDRMEAVGYTDDVAKTQEICAATGENYILVDNLDDFEDMCVATLALEGTGEYAVSAAAWDLEKAIVLGAYTESGYFTSTKRKENTLAGLETMGSDQYVVTNGASTPEYIDVLQREYDWTKKRVVSSDMNSIKLESAESAFISGNTSVFVVDPTIQHLIQVARKTQVENPSATFTVLPPLRAHRDEAECPKNEDGSVKKGFMRNTHAVFAAGFAKTSKNVDAVLAFMNWVFESEDNYNLCYLGIEGEHWVDNGDGTYSYPAGKEGYITSPPYSGILALVENQNRSNLTYKGYTEEELHWINDIAGNPDNYLDNDLIDYRFVLSQDAKAQESSAGGKLYEAVVQAWTGNANPSTTFASAQRAYINATSATRKMWTDQYLLMYNRRHNK